MTQALQWAGVQQWATVTVNVGSLAGGMAALRNGGLYVLMVQEGGGGSSSDDWPPDLSKIKRRLQDLAKRYAPKACKCDLFANAAAKTIIAQGHQADIVRIEYMAIDHKPGFILTSDNTVAGITGFHEAVRIRRQGYKDMFIDAEVFLKNGPHPVIWEDYQKYYQYSELFTIVSSRMPK